MGCLLAAWSATAGLPVVADARVAGSTCTTTNNSCSVTGACGLEACTRCTAGSPWVRGACSDADLLAEESSCATYCEDAAAAPSPAAPAALLMVCVCFSLGQKAMSTTAAWAARGDVKAAASPEELPTLRGRNRRGATAPLPPHSPPP
ncbi:surface antigen protein 2 [Novymonas esmeraldas]|uniref:Surface antigen protein 2 n=1 Tax=Novymonas esmeraldas TaxID=1808958 RepID=A0AAW0EXS2_9TRYP